MSNIELLNKEELEKNPEAIGESIKLLAIALKETKGNLEEIKTRGFWKKIISDNTKDLAEAMLKQNDSISAFLTIIQGVLFLSMNNVTVLGAIMDSLNKSESANELRDNEYAAMAREYLAEALKSAKRALNNEEEIGKIKEIILERHQNQFAKDSEQDRLIDESFERDKEQDKLIVESLERDDEQDKDVLALKSRIESLESAFKTMKYAFVGIGLASLAVSVASLIINLL